LERANREVSSGGTTLSNAARPEIPDRLAAAPISWGVCEVPGWGLQLDPDRVLAEMRTLGIAATEAGPEGYLGPEVADARALLARHELKLVGGFLPVVLHQPAKLDASLDKVRRTAALFSALGARVLCSAVVVDVDWSPRFELDERQWDHLLRALARLDEAAAEQGVQHVLHPHWGTLVEQDGDVRRVLDGSDVRVCLDTGHLVLGRSNPLEIARTYAGRVAHVHLKDVRATVAERLRSGELDLLEAVQQGLFQPLGAGDVAVDEVVVELERSGYAGWYVLEQDTAILGRAPAAGEGPVEDVRRSIGFLRAVAQRAARNLVAATEGR
jgi:inosose dehydratase